MERFREYWRALAVDRGRMILVTLGIVWGVLSLTVVLAFGGGLERAMAQATENSGVDLLRVWAGSTTRPWQGRVAGSRVRLTDDDARYLERAIPELRGVSVEYISPGVPISFGRRSSNAGLHGVDALYQQVRRFPVQAGGRFINRNDEIERRRVVFLGDAVKARLFGEREAVGEEIELFGFPFTVIGVLQPKTTISNYEGQDRFKVLIPASTFKALRGAQYVTYLLLWLPDLVNDARFLEEVYIKMAERHGFDPQDRKAIGVMNHVEIYRRVNSIVGSTRLLLGIVTFFGFIVSLVGVGNVMYVMVEERRKEFGVQLALGARPGEILRDRLGEALLVTLLGGLMGIVLSAGLIAVMRSVPLDPEARSLLGYPEISLPAAMVIAALLGIAGAIAGYWPAKRAAGVDPVQVLHD